MQDIVEDLHSPTSIGGLTILSLHFADDADQLRINETELLDLTTRLNKIIVNNNNRNTVTNTMLNGERFDCGYLQVKDPL